MKESCPGSSEIRNPYPEELKCYYCGHVNEIWSDETETQCKGCGKTISREMKPTCLDWCPAARECVGLEKYNRLKKPSGQDGH
ncbi:MAG: phosphohydrolase [Nitrospirae bacterium]|nr:phosphohydrolase [Nitrospirota bacterium]